MSIAPVALDDLDKAHDTEALLDSLRPFSIEKVRGREEGLAAVRHVFEAYDGTTVPSEDLAATEAAIDRFGDLVDFSRYAQPRLVEATAVPATTTVWTAIVAGGSLALTGAVGLLVSRRTSRARGSSPA
ncbi:hypothetical protein F0U44_03585 [Nocardioides humilatus]|uniref:Uncharacterized protein n=2 Tax=Nocardioides humilatus TaxID=2607660 RepID=A0A5B1LLE0_9ACTN|nr:hypothetical protein F0U44_03585 [Nocardioides humilatus]